MQTQAFRVFFEAYTSGTCKTLIDGFLKTILTEDAGHTVDGSEIRRSQVDMENLSSFMGII